MTKEMTTLFLAALADQIEKGQILVESLETTQNDESGHITLHWLSLPRPVEQESERKVESWLR